jgi:hypothetical protein
MENSLSAKLYYDPKHFCLHCRGLGVVQLNGRNSFCRECFGKGDRLLGNIKVVHDLKCEMSPSFGQYYFVAVFATHHANGGTLHDLYGGGVLHYLYHDWMWRTNPDFKHCSRHFSDRKSAMKFLNSKVLY